MVVSEASRVNLDSGYWQAEKTCAKPTDSLEEGPAGLVKMETAQPVARKALKDDMSL